MSFAHRLTVDAMSAVNRYSLFSRVAFLTGSAVTISALTIFVFNTTFSRMQVETVFTGMEIIGLSLVPYLISAVVAAITAICVLSLVPLTNLQQPATVVKQRLQSLAEGDLASKVMTRGAAPHIQELVYEVNLASSNLGSQIAQWKVINRQQWELLEAMREITVVSGQRQIVRIIEQMEKNWEKIAEIEARLKT